MIKSCIFDLDGTLTDTLESLAYSVQLTLEEMGLQKITKEQCKSFVGNGARRLMELSLQAAGADPCERLEEGMRIYGRIFDANCTYHVTPYEGIVSTLKNLKDRGIRTAVLSNKPDEQADKVVREIFGDGVFDFVQGQKEGVKRKPDPEGVYQAAEALEVKKEECLYIGDSEVDVETGHRAQVSTVAVSWGFRERKELLEAGAERIIDRPEELLQFV